MVANTTNSVTDVKVNKARLTPGLRRIGLANIVLDEALQPRAGVDFDWANSLSTFLKEGSTFPAVKVVQLPDARLVLASGFHRYHATRLAGTEDDILCDVIDGTWEEAVVIAAGSNKGNGVKPMGPKDITKAVEMLLLIDQWWNRANLWIGKHVGCSDGKVARIRKRLAARLGKEIPSTLENIIGKKRKQPLLDCPNNKKVKINSLNLILDSLKFSLCCSRHNRFLSGLGRTFYLQEFLACACDFSTPDSLPATIGRLIAARRYKGDLSARMVVLCYHEDGPQKVIDLYRQEGFEFLTPEELEAELKASDESKD